MKNESPALHPRNRAALGDVIGTPELCAWQTAPGVTWIQTRSPEFARKLSRRSDARLVAIGVDGGFLRTFIFRHTLAWARSLIVRYTGAEAVTNGVKNSPALRSAGHKPEVRLT